MSAQEARAEPEALHPGARLGQAREALGIARGDVAASLHLEEEMLAALEEGREEDLPAQAYVRGYMRAYARLVGLDPQQLVERFDGDMGSRSERPSLGQPPAPPRSFAERAQRHMGLLLGGIVAAMLIAAAAALWFAWRSADWPFAGAPQDPAATVALGRIAVDPVVDKHANAAPGGPAVAGQGAWSVAPGPDPDRLAAQRASVLAPVPTVDGAAPAGHAPLPGGTLAGDLPSVPGATAPGRRSGGVGVGDLAAPASPRDSLSFRFSDDSWVEVRDGAGALVHADLSRSGETLTLGGAPPFAILLGYAAGVRLSYNGSPVALGPHTNQNVARLVVGH